MTRIVLMIKVASVSKVKASLSMYLEHVKSGEEVVITERGRPIARVIPCDAPADIEDLVAAGIVRLPTKPGPLPGEYWDNLVTDPEGYALTALLAEREEDQR
jgi:prevent-host-death family protein